MFAKMDWQTFLFTAYIAAVFLDILLRR